MKTIQTEIEIKSSPKQIWEVLMDFQSYPEWNPFIKSISGEQKAGSELSVLLQPPGGSEFKMNPVVQVCKPNEEFRWLGKLWGGIFFNGEHYFLLHDNGNGTVQFVHGEKFTGILVGLLGGMLKKTKEGFQTMNVALKERVEK